MIQANLTEFGQNFIALLQIFLVGMPMPKFAHEQISAHIHTAKNERK